MPALEIVALDTATPQILAPQTGDTYSAPRALAISPQSLTGTSATTSLDIAQTWNTTGTPTAVKLNVTDTASNANSLLMDLQVGGTSRLFVDKFGRAWSAQPAGSPSTNYVAQQGATANWFEGRWGASLVPARLRVENGVPSLDLGATGMVRWSNDATGTATLDTILARDAANTLAQRNATNPQNFRVYNTYTDASNYERGSIGWSGNILTIAAENAGTGANRGITLQGKGETIVESTLSQITFRTSSTGRWAVYANGILGTVVDNALDIGASGANRPRNIYIAGTIDVGSGNLSLASDVRLSRRSSGVLLLDNNGGTDFGRLQFGGTTSSFPAIKRSSATLQARLADDSDYAIIDCSQIGTTKAYTVATLPAAGTAGRRAYVTDATTPTFLGALTGGGAVVCPVFDNGTAWVAG